MEMKNRQTHRVIPVTGKDLEAQSWCPCCKTGSITRNTGAPMATCTECKQRYQIEEVEDGEAKT